MPSSAAARWDCCRRSRCSCAAGASPSSSAASPRGVPRSGTAAARRCRWGRGAAAGGGRRWVRASQEEPPQRRPHPRQAAAGCCMRRFPWGRPSRSFPAPVPPAQVVVDAGLLTQEELEACITSEYNPVRQGARRGPLAGRTGPRPSAPRQRAARRAARARATGAHALPRRLLTGSPSRFLPVSPCPPQGRLPRRRGHLHPGLPQHRRPAARAAGLRARQVRRGRV
jgi:hypothetical protein